MTRKDYPPVRYPQAEIDRLRKVEDAARGAMACDEGEHLAAQEYLMTPVVRVDVSEAANDGLVDEPEQAIMRPVAAAR